MKRIMQYSVQLVSVSLLILVVSCGKKSPTSSPPLSFTSLQKTSMIVMKAAAKLSSASSMSAFPVPGGSLNVQSALLNIEKFRIEENTGFDGQQQGGANDNDKGSSEKKDSPGAENDTPDIIITGPFSIDISSNEVFLDSVAAYPGTFKKVNFTLIPNTSPPFNGKTIIINGEFVPTNGAAIAVTIKSEFAKEIQTRIAGGGITVADNSIVPVVVTFDLAGMFNNVDFGSAQVKNGEIIVDNVSNAALLTVFETNLTKYVEVEEKM